jgi:hypothetical protein
MYPWRNLREQYVKKISDVAGEAGGCPALSNFVVSSLQNNLSNEEIINNFERLRTRPRISEDHTFLRGGISFIELITLREEHSVWPLRNHGLTVSRVPLYTRFGNISGADENDLRTELRRLLATTLESIRIQDSSFLARFMAYPDLGDWIVQKITGNTSSRFPTPAQASDYCFARDADGRVLGQPSSADPGVTYFLKKVLCACKSVGSGVIRALWSPISAIANIRTTAVGLVNLVYRFGLLFTGDWSLVDDIVEATRKYWNEQPIEFCTEVLLNLGLIYVTAIPALSAARTVAATTRVATDAVLTGGRIAAITAAHATAGVGVAYTLPPAPVVGAPPAPEAPKADPVTAATEWDEEVSVEGDGRVEAVSAELDDIEYVEDIDIPSEPQISNVPSVLDALYLTLASADPELASTVRRTVINRGTRQHVINAINGTYGL